jgi:hypothetical protein
MCCRSSDVFLDTVLREDPSHALAVGSLALIPQLPATLECLLNSVSDALVSTPDCLAKSVTEETVPESGTMASRPIPADIMTRRMCVWMGPLAPFSHELSLEGVGGL